MALQGADKVIKTLEDIVQKVKSANEVRVGFMEGATYPGGVPVASVAYWNEYGHAGKFPALPRPFFRNMIAAEKSEWPVKIGKLAVATNYDAHKVLELMGQDIKGALQQSITELNSPKLSKTTLMLREMFGNSPEKIRARDVLEAQELVAEGHEGAANTQAKPLIWTGHMINSVDYEVKE